MMSSMTAEKEIRRKALRLVVIVSNGSTTCAEHAHRPRCAILTSFLLTCVTLVNQVIVGSSLRPTSQSFCFGLGSLSLALIPQRKSLTDSVFVDLEVLGRCSCSPQRSWNSSNIDRSLLETSPNLLLSKLSHFPDAFVALLRSASVALLRSASPVQRSESGPRSRVSLYFS